MDVINPLINPKKKTLDQFPAILTSHLVNNLYLYTDAQVKPRTSVKQLSRVKLCRSLTQQSRFTHLDQLKLQFSSSNVKFDV